MEIDQSDLDSGKVVKTADGVFYFKEAAHDNMQCNGKYPMWSRLHRTGAPAVVMNSGFTAYYVDGYLHNDNGPAMVWPDGCKIGFVDGKMQYRLKGKYE